VPTTSPATLPDPSEHLRRHGLQVTAQRLAVLRAVCEQPHATADTIEVQVRSTLGAVSRQAVYDALTVLADKGLIRRIQPARSAARYEDRVDDNHHHLVCRSCGLTVDVDCAVGRAPCLTTSHDRGFVVDEAEVIYWGICPGCQSTGRGRRRPASRPDRIEATRRERKP
jgi:Fe2+ or Zn2+ uptake regulation protein